MNEWIYWHKWMNRMLHEPQVMAWSAQSWNTAQHQQILEHTMMPWLTDLGFFDDLHGLLRVSNSRLHLIVAGQQLRQLPPDTLQKLVHDGPLRSTRLAAPSDPVPSELAVVLPGLTVVLSASGRELTAECGVNTLTPLGHCLSSQLHCKRHARKQE